MDRERARALQRQIPNLRVPSRSSRTTTTSMSEANSGPAIAMRRGTRTFSRVDPLTSIRKSAFLDPAYQPRENWERTVPVPSGYVVNKDADPVAEFYRIRSEIFARNPSLAKEFQFNALKTSPFLDPTYKPEVDWYFNFQIPFGFEIDERLRPDDDFHRIRDEIFTQFPQLREIYRDRLNRLDLISARLETQAKSDNQKLLEDELRRSDSEVLGKSAEGLTLPCSIEEIYYPDYIEELRRSSPSSMRNSAEFIYYMTSPFQNGANFQALDPTNPNLLTYVGPSIEEWENERKEFFASRNIVLNAVSFPTELKLNKQPWDEEDIKKSLNEIDEDNSSKINFLREEINFLRNSGSDYRLLALKKLQLQRNQTAKYLEKISHEITRPIKLELVNDILMTALEISDIKDLENVYGYHPDTYFFKVMNLAILYLHGEFGDVINHYNPEGKLMFVPEEFAYFIRRNDGLI